MNKTPVKYFTAILTSQKKLLPDVLKRLEKYLGKADHIGDWVPFTFTDFYEPEMGRDLQRVMVSFAKLLPVQILPKVKRWTQKIENKFRVKGDRVVNIDAGYVDFCKVVLVSGKFGGHKIALTDECYADMIMDYQKGTFHPMPWCFPDFKSGIYNKDLLKIRSLLRPAV